MLKIEPISIKLQCCLDQIDCNSGICRNEGNFQICATALTNSITGNDYTLKESTFTYPEHNITPLHTDTLLLSVSIEPTIALPDILGFSASLLLTR